MGDEGLVISSFEVVPGLTSHYRWSGVPAITRGNEALPVSRAILRENRSISNFAASTISTLFRRNCRNMQD